MGLSRFGFASWDAAGRVTLDTGDIVMRLYATIRGPIARAGRTSYPCQGVTPDDTIAILVPDGTGNGPTGVVTVGYNEIILAPLAGDQCYQGDFITVMKRS